MGTQVEIGAGDTHGPLLGMKIFRNLTPRLYVLQCKEKMSRPFCFFSFFFFLFFFSFGEINGLLNVHLTFRFSQLSFVTAQCGLQFSSRGVRPGLTTVLARHLDKNTMGYLQWRWGIQSSMNTSIVRDTKSSHFTFAMQVCGQHLNLIFQPAETPCKLTVACQKLCVKKKKHFSPPPAAWHSSHVCDDELSIQVPR